MPSRKHRPEKIFGKLREGEVCCTGCHDSGRAVGSQSANKPIISDGGIWRPEDRPGAPDADPTGHTVAAAIRDAKAGPRRPFPILGPRRMFMLGIRYVPFFPGNASY